MQDGLLYLRNFLSKFHYRVNVLLNISFLFHNSFYSKLIRLSLNRFLTTVEGKLIRKLNERMCKFAKKKKTMKAYDKVSNLYRYISMYHREKLNIQLSRSYVL